MVPGGYIALPNSQAGAIVAVIIQVEQFDRSPSSWGAPNDPNKVDIPRKVVSPHFLTRIEDWYDLTRFRVASLTAITTPFVAVSAR